jgi:hypothetical protein
MTMLRTLSIVPACLRQIFQVANANSPSSQLQLYAKENFHE